MNQPGAQVIRFLFRLSIFSQAVEGHPAHGLALILRGLGQGCDNCLIPRLDLTECGDYVAAHVTIILVVEPD
jgi:hypothetical protein